MGDITTVLDIDAIVPDRAPVRIRTKNNPDGKLYEIRNRKELSLEQIKTIEILSVKCEEMMVKIEVGGENSIDEADAAMLDSWIHTLLELVFYTPLEKETEEALDYPQKFKIFAAFNAASLTDGTQEAVPTPKPRATPKPKKKTPRQTSVSR